ncbi:MAG: hypothetical protein NXY57DRAFT_919521 [Lentinula lateritia]|uniref:Uncharacterized protein n=1 Tax=Lentinula lateritia TaxID=40482 RepID=A0ABQ8VU91_9AGAR|nr:MAG: hypothetical protein NXY57DRAFT_919521 [Lentinula lateritia]KAJ4499925.1 hypothetical protein C8R41DRAFT_977859 [Lentinula lateritia]
MLSASSTRQQIFTAVQSNTKHQYALEKYSQRLTAELQEIDKLLAAADVGDSDNEQPGDVEIQGASRATGPIPDHEFLNPVSPFFSEAIKRSRYCKSTVTHAMRPKELGTLTDAVTAEFRRLRILEGQGSASSAIDLTSNTDRLNWKTIAEKVSDASYSLRSDRECKTKWVGYQRPGICHDDWTLDELKKLKEIVADKEKDEEYELDWVDVALELGTNRTPIDCMRHGFKRVNHTWAPEADRKLFEAVQVYGTENWALVAIHVSPNVTSVQCQMRYNRSLDPLLNKSPWSSAEDERLNEIVSVLGSSSWPEVARHIPGRTNEMCRERYLERIKAKGQVNKGKAKAEGDDGNSAQETEGDEPREAIARSEWTKEEDEELVRMVGEMGNKWQKISAATGGVHTNVQCRIRYKKLKNGTLSTDTNRSSHSASITNDQPSRTSAPPPPDLSPNAYLSLAPSGSRHALTFITSDSHPPILQLAPTSIAQSSTSPNVSVAQPSKSSLALAKPRPKPKSKAKTNVPPQSMTSHTNTTHNSHDNEQQPFSSNSAVITSSVISSTTTVPPRPARKRPSHRRAVVLSTAITENLETLEPTRGVTSVLSQAQIRGWEAEGHSSIESQVTGWGAEKGREADGLVQGWEGEGRVREWEGNTNPALKIITGAAAEVMSDIEGPDPSERAGSHSFATGSPLSRKRQRDESSDTMSLSASKNTVSVQDKNSSEAGVESTTNIEHAIGNTSTPQRRPARKKERSRKRTADWSVVPVSPTTSSLPSTPASGSSTLRRSTRLAGKS